MRMLPPPEFMEGTGHIVDPSDGKVIGVVHTTLSGSAPDYTRLERWVLFDRTRFEAGTSWKGERRSGADQTWAQLKASIDPEEVEGWFEITVTSTAPPANANDTGETGTFQAFMLRRSPPNSGGPIQGGLLRIKDGSTWREHWALFNNWIEPDGTYFFTAEAQGNPPSSVGAFFQEVLQSGVWWNSPRAGAHIHVSGYTIQTGSLP